MCSLRFIHQNRFISDDQIVLSLHTTFEMSYAQTFLKVRLNYSFRHNSQKVQTISTAAILIFIIPSLFLRETREVSVFHHKKVAFDSIHFIFKRHLPEIYLENIWFIDRFILLSHQITRDIYSSPPFRSPFYSRLKHKQSRAIRAYRPPPPSNPFIMHPYRASPSHLVSLPPLHVRRCSEE